MSPPSKAGIYRFDTGDGVMSKAERQLISELHALRLQVGRTNYAASAVLRLPAAACEDALVMMTDFMQSSRYVEQYLRSVAETKAAKGESACEGASMDEAALTELVSRWLAKVSERYSSMTLSELQEIAAGQTGKWQRRRRDVASFVRSRRLTNFVEEQNAKGLAPRIGQATAALAGHDAAAPLGNAGSGPSFARLKLRSRVQWVRRRCHGLGLKTGVFKVGANLAMAVRRRKAR